MIGMNPLIFKFQSDSINTMKERAYTPIYIYFKFQSDSINTNIILSTVFFMSSTLNSNLILLIHVCQSRKTESFLYFKFQSDSINTQNSVKS